MTPQQRLAALLKEQAAQVNHWNAERRGCAGDVTRILHMAEARIQAALGNMPTDWQSYQLPRLKRAVRAALMEVEQELHGAAMYRHGRAVVLGQAAVDFPLLAAGLNIGSLAAFLAPVVDTRQLAAMRHFLTGKMSDIAKRAQRSINDQLGLVMAGAQTPHEAQTTITLLLQGDKGRAMTAMRTELARAYSAATSERMRDLKPYVPGMKKIWRKSNKRPGRSTHASVDGQIRAVDEPFDVNGEHLMYPCDPKGSAENTINCGCKSLIWVDDWNLKLPERAA